MTISELKSNAKVKLSGKWGKAILINLIYIIVTLVLTTISSIIPIAIISAILSLAVIIIILPLSYGIVVSMIKLYRDEEVGLTDFITLGLEKIGTVFKVYFSMILRLWLPILLSIIGGVVLSYAIVSSFTGGNNTGALYIVGISVIIIASILSIVKSLLYGLSLYLLYDNENSTAKELLNKSAELMNGNRKKYFLLELSFIGWFFLLGIISGILSEIQPVIGTIVTYVGSLFLTPYISFASIGFYEELIGTKNVESDPISE